MNGKTLEAQGLTAEQARRMRPSLRHALRVAAGLEHAKPIDPMEEAYARIPVPRLTAQPYGYPGDPWHDPDGEEWQPGDMGWLVGDRLDPGRLLMVTGDGCWLCVTPGGGSVDEADTDPGCVPVSAYLEDGEGVESFIGADCPPADPTPRKVRIRVTPRTE